MSRALWICGAIAGVAGAAELPVKKVVLYKHGLGYFERAGELAAGESARLDFKPEEMNDVLKSLTLETAGEDKVVALRYDASDSLEKKLSRLPIKIEPGQPLSKLLDQLKGERLELRFGSEALAGVIVGARLAAATRDQPEREDITLLLESGALVTRVLGAASEVRLADPELQLLMKEYLQVLAGSRSVDRRSVYIDSTDTGTRSVRASYMIPTPVWKSSYRLIFSGADGPTLEGWAIVDNTTDADWTNVSLSLVSGRPISFVSPLYEARYVDRPVAELPEDRPVRPDLYEGAMEQAKAARPALKPGRPAKDNDALMASVARRIGDVSALAAAGEAAAAAPSTVADTAAARELGELFEYRFDRPVTVRRNESAMLPFLQQKISARKLVVYSDRSSVHPRHAAELENVTGKTLDGGPITVFEEGAYGGEALVETLKSGDKRLISYGIDLGTRVTTKYDSEQSRVREAHFRRGVLTATSAIREVQTYSIRNVDQKPKTLVIEHPARATYRLISPEPAEKTPSAYRFAVKLGPGAGERLTVTEERPLVQTLTVANLTPDVLVTYVENKELSAQARDQLGRILAQKRKIAASDGDIRRLEIQIQELEKDQERLRQNITALNRVSGQQEQVQKYATLLAGQEARLASLRDSLGEARNTKTALENELNAMIEAMEF